VFIFPPPPPHPTTGRGETCRAGDGASRLSLIQDLFIDVFSLVRMVFIGGGSACG